MPTKMATKATKVVPGCPSEEELDAMIAEGAATLDAVSPNWFEKIDLPRLDLTDGIQCILGQLYGSFMQGRRILKWSFEYCAELGFYYDRPDGLSEEEYTIAFDTFYEIAQECWFGEIGDRLRGDK